MKKKSYINFSLRVPPDMYERVQREAEQNFRSMNKEFLSHTEFFWKYREQNNQGAQQ